MNVGGVIYRLDHIKTSIKTPQTLLTLEAAQRRTRKSLPLLFSSK